jgi:hypothetical protein
VYSDYLCFDDGKFGCTPSTFVSDIGDTTAWYEATWYLLNVKGTGTGYGNHSNTAKATTATTPYGKAPTPYGNASFLTGMRRYLNLIHPWTTGFAKVHNAKTSPPGKTRWGRTTRPPWVIPAQAPGPITPQAQGYDINLGGADITVTRYDWNQVWQSTLSTPTTITVTTKQYLYGVGRVVSMVRPRLIHTYTVPLDPGDPITNTRQVARLWRLTVFFVPEPAGMLLLGAGAAALLGLSRMRRR